MTQLNVNVPKTMSADARAENEACQAVVAEFRAFLTQNAAPGVAVKMCKQLEDRIEIRRLLASPKEQP